MAGLVKWVRLWTKCPQYRVIMTIGDAFHSAVKVANLAKTECTFLAMKANHIKILAEVVKNESFSFLVPIRT